MTSPSEPAARVDVEQLAAAMHDAYWPRCNFEDMREINPERRWWLYVAGELLAGRLRPTTEGLLAVEEKPPMSRVIGEAWRDPDEAPRIARAAAAAAELLNIQAPGSSATPVAGDPGLIVGAGVGEGPALTGTSRPAPGGPGDGPGTGGGDQVQGLVPAEPTGRVPFHQRITEADRAAARAALAGTGIESSAAYWLGTLGGICEHYADLGGICEQLARDVYAAIEQIVRPAPAAVEASPEPAPRCGPLPRYTGADLAMTPTRRRVLSEVEHGEVYAEAGQAWDSVLARKYTGVVTELLSASWVREGPSKDAAGRPLYELTTTGRIAAATYDEAQS